jgi:hypothetical protein
VLIHYKWNNHNGAARQPWPGVPHAGEGAGLEFFVSFCFKTKRKKTIEKNILLPFRKQKSQRTLKTKKPI